MYWLDSPEEKLKMKTDDPYAEIVEIFRKLKRCREGNFVAWVYTDNLGYDVVLCEYDGNNDEYVWSTDWYEGGDCYLLYIAELADIEPEITQKWEGYNDR